MSLSAYLADLKRAISAQDGYKLRQLFRLDSDAFLYVSQLGSRSVPLAEVNKQMGIWGDIVASFLQALQYYSQGERIAACKELRERHGKLLLDCLNEEIWILPAIIGMANTLRIMSAQADEDAKRLQGTKSSQLQLPACAMFCQHIFRLTAASKGADSERKKSVALGVVCIMIKVYFRLNTITNCKNVVKQADTLNIFDSTEASNRVTFRYYTGRLAAYDEDFKTANEHLTYAFSQCHPRALSNKRRILRYLIPIRMLLGVLPSKELLQQYKLTEFEGICDAMRAGDVGLLMRTLDAHQTQLVQAGTYLLLEKLQLAVYRRLFRKCALVHAEANPAKATQVPLALFQHALELQGISKDDVELQCLVANLIYRKFIKGYIAYKARVVVLAKTDAFPPMAEVQLGDPFK